MKQEADNKKILKLLLETYSVEEIKDIFKRIDNRIIDLMEFSSKDFIGINKVLKDSYNDIKSLETLSNEIFSLKTCELARQALTDLKRTKKALTSTDKQYKKMVNEIIILRQDISHIDPILKINVKNLKQNIISLKLWVTNNRMELEKVESSIPDESVNKKYDHQLSAILNLLEDTLKNPHETILHLNTILDKLELNIKYDFDKNLDNLAFETHEEVINMIKKRLEENNEAVSSIITKLQYHDIVRQKVEHIQEIHNEIIKELDLIKVQPDKTDLHNEVKYFFQIRDISGLQAAQLFHVNNDYQKAIKTITSSLLTISENIDKISSGCVEYAQKTENCPKELSKLYKDYGKVADNWQQLKFDASVDDLNNIVGSLTKVNDMFDGIKEFDSYLPLFADERLNSDTLKQVNDILNSIRTNVSDCLGFAPDYEKFITKVKNITEVANEFNIQQKAILINKPLANQLHVNASEISTKLNEIKTNARGLSQTLNEVVDNIAYYEYFDQVIEQVIDELNTINISLLEEDIASDPVAKKKNLEFIKQKYTMQSEHNIHENTLNNTLSEDSKEDDVDDNDVEFF